MRNKDEKNLRSAKKFRQLNDRIRAQFPERGQKSDEETTNK